MKYLVLNLILLIFAPLSFAQQTTPLPVCTHTYFDADNDGYGWTGSESCVVTDESEPAPVLINKETGGVVELVRPYWDPNTDIAGRHIVCESFIFDPESAGYRNVDNRFGGIAFNDDGRYSRMFYYHEPLASLGSDSEYNYHNTVYARYGSDVPDDADPEAQALEEFYGTPQYDFNRLPLWTVRDGIVYSESSLWDPYVQIVDFNGGSRNAVRFWGGVGPVNWGRAEGNEAFQTCYALDGDPLVPTGQHGIAGSVLEKLNEDVIVALGDAENDPSPMTNLETGQPVEFSNTFYNYNRAIAGRRINCSDYAFGYEVEGRYDVAFFDLSIYATEFIFHPYNGGENIWVTYRHPGADYPGYGWQTEKVSSSDGILSVFGQNIEMTEDGFRDWSSENYFSQCYSRFSPEITQQTPTEDDDTSEVQTTDSTDESGNDSDVEDTATDSVDELNSNTGADDESASDSSTDNGNGDTGASIATTSDSDSSISQSDSSGSSGGGVFGFLALLFFVWRIKKNVKPFYREQ